MENRLKKLVIVAIIMSVGNKFFWMIVRKDVNFMNTLAIIGSFRKHYDEIRELIQHFSKSGILVTSPKYSTITHSREDFVVFESDDNDLSNAEIQLVTLGNILSADIVYVYNPEGYIGKTTSYEIGICTTLHKKIYYFAKPVDLPVVFVNSQIVDKDSISKDFAKYYSMEHGFKLRYEAKKVFSDYFTEKEEIVKPNLSRIVICGSMTFYDEMTELKNELQKKGIDCIIPAQENHLIDDFTEEQMNEFKRKVSNSYLAKIRNRNTESILIYNQKKRGIDNYIGPNTLVEIAMAFAWYRKIYLYYDLYEPFADELKAWGAISLNGSLDLLTIDNVDCSTEREDSQMSLFDWRE